MGRPGLLVCSAIAGLVAGGAAALHAAPEAARGGRLFVLHSGPAGSCPSLDWHLLSEPNGVLIGMIAWDNMRFMARASGIMNNQKNTFRMVATPFVGGGRKATIEGKVRADGSLVADVRGTHMTCLGIVVPPYNMADTK
jgi:hypothetical protein